jgi:tetratricopeptide (TPR) repeat protein
LSQQALGRVADARKSFQLALDLDGLRFRVDSKLNEIIRQTAKGRTNEGIFFLDSEMAIRDGETIPGKEIFWEHVHFNFAGNYRIARGVAKELAGLWRDQPDQSKTWLSLDEARRRLSFTELNQLKLTEHMLLRLQKAPFIEQLGHQQRTNELAQALQRLEGSKGEEALKAQIAQSREAILISSNDWRLAANLATLSQEVGNWPEALKQWQRVTVLLPHYAQAHFACGNALYNQNKIEEAMNCFQRALELRSDCAEAINGLGNSLYALGKVDEALSKYRQAVDLQSDNPTFHHNVALALAKKGQREEAMQEYRKAISISPPDGSSTVKLANLLTAEGRSREAEELYKSFLQQYPANLQVRQDYVDYLAKRERYAEIIIQLQALLEQNPSYIEARYNLAKSLIALKRYPEAIAECEKLQALRPNWPPVEQLLEKAQRKQRGE